MKALLITLISDQEIARFNATVTKSIKNVNLSKLTNFSVPRSLYFWGLASSKRNLEIWKKLDANDYVIFLLQNSLCITKVQNKTRNKDIAFMLWNKFHTYPRSFELIFSFTKTIFYSSDTKEYVSFKKMTKFNLYRDSITLIDKLGLENNNIKSLLTKSTVIKSSSLNTHDVELTAIDFEEPPKRIKTIVRRIIRDTYKTLKIKEKYNYECQVCGYILEIDSDRYAEVHHIWPLGEGGLDNFDNMIVLCPNHHAEFDLCNIAIDPNNGKTILKKSESDGEIYIHEFHKLNRSNLAYHFDKFKKIHNEP